MALPMNPATQWFRDLEEAFSPFEAVTDDYRLYEEDDEFVLTIDVPGFDRDEIDVAWDDGVLNVAAAYVDEDRGRERTYHRRFRFPKDVDEDAITATYRNGVLEVTLPVAEESTVRGAEIPIEG